MLLVLLKTTELLDVLTTLDTVLEAAALDDVKDDEPTEDEVSGTPFGPAMISKIFSGAVELKTVGARET